VLDSGRALFYQLLNLITMNISKIKSFVFGLAFLGAMGFGGFAANAQEDGEPCPDGSTTTSWGGVCCQSFSSCQHPYAGNIAASSWRDCVATCS
jgi:hypothetical protein